MDKDDLIKKIINEYADALDKLANGPKHLQKELTLTKRAILEQVGPFVNNEEMDQILKGLGYL